jgi:hypothetical protein
MLKLMNILYSGSYCQRIIPQRTFFNRLNDFITGSEKRGSKCVAVNTDMAPAVSEMYSRLFSVFVPSYHMPNAVISAYMEHHWKPDQLKTLTAAHFNQSSFLAFTHV